MYEFWPQKVAAYVRPRRLLLVESGPALLKDSVFVAPDAAPLLQEAASKVRVP